MTDYTRDEASRREYWRAQMEAAYAFTEKIKKYPLTECCEPMVSVRQAVKDARLTVKFSDTKIADKYERVFFLRKGLIKNFLAVAKEMNNRGCFLKVEDCFRTRNMQRYVGLQDSVFDAVLKKVIWENNGEAPSPELMFRRLNAFIAITSKIAPHISGSSIDISVYQASNLSEMDCGGSYLEISELTFMDSPFISQEESKNRKEIKRIMKTHGFIAYPFEFWHFSQGDAYAEQLTKSNNNARYGAVHFDLTSGQIVPLDKQDMPLYSMDEIQEKIESALTHINK